MAMANEEEIEVENSSSSKTRDEKTQKSYHLCWNEFNANFMAFFRELREREEFIDVTLACEGQHVSAHKVVLSASSPFFRALLKNHPCEHPIIILNEVSYCELLTLLQYIYHGEVQVSHHKIADFLRTARLLQVRGLAESILDHNNSSAEGSVGRTSVAEELSIAKSERCQEPNYRDSHSHRRPRLYGDRPVSPTLRSHLASDEEGRPESPSPMKRFKFNSSSPIPSPHLHAVTSSPMPIVPHMSHFPIGFPPMLQSGLPGLPLPLSLPSTITPLPPAPSPLHRLSTPHSYHSIMFPGLPSEDTQDTDASDRSDDRDLSRFGHADMDDTSENETALDKMSGLANMAALKGLSGFPGPSALMGLSSGALSSGAEGSTGRPRFDFYRVRATDPRPCHLCGKIYKNAHTLRTHMEDKHSNCNGFRCVLCGTVAKSRNSLHSHMSRQHRGISTKDLPLLPMPAPWNPEMAAKYIQMLGGVGEVVRQNYRRSDKDNSSNDSASTTPTISATQKDLEMTSHENGGIYKSELCRQDDDEYKNKYPYDAFSRHLDMYRSKPVGSSLLDTYLQMMRASGMDLSSPLSSDRYREEMLRFPPSRINAGLDLSRPEMGRRTPSRNEDRSSDFSDDEPLTRKDKRKATLHLGGGATIVTVTSQTAEAHEATNDTKWAVTN